MTARARLSAMCIFCDDIREDKNGSDIIIGVYPDNVAIATPQGMLPRLAVYIRLSIPIEHLPRSIKHRIEFPWNDPPFEMADVPQEKIVGGAAKVRADGGPMLGLISKVVFSPFQVKSLGRLKVIATVDGEEFLGGALNFVAAVPPEKSPAG